MAQNSMTDFAFDIGEWVVPRRSFADDDAALYTERTGERAMIVLARVRLEEPGGGTRNEYHVRTDRLGGSQMVGIHELELESQETALARVKLFRAARDAEIKAAKVAR